MAKAVVMTEAFAEKVEATVRWWETQTGHAVDMNRSRRGNKAGTGAITCTQLRRLFDIPDEFPDEDTIGWVPRFNEADDTESCTYEPLKNCPEEPAPTSFQTLSQLPIASTYQTGVIVTILNDPNLGRVSFYASGPGGQSATWWVEQP